MTGALPLALGLRESGCLRAAVIGAGSMGAGIAAQFANAGVMVDLLDIPSEGARNARAEAGIANQIKAGGFMGQAPVALVRPGNTEDNFDRLAAADWIVEAVIENLAVKRDLYARIEPLAKPGAVISSNTSTIPRAALIEGRSPDFAARFVIGHFFNPPRHMALLELVAPEGSPAEAFARQAGRVALGKTVIACRDTPGFIANRIGCTWMSVAIVETIRLGLSIEQADAVHTAFGVPRTGVFGLCDLVGIDMIPSIWASLMQALPGGDAINRYDLPAQPLVQKMIAAGRFGRKSGAGFYRRAADGAAEVIDPQTAQYIPATGFAAKDLPGGGRDLEALIADETGLGAYARAVLGAVLRYAQDHAGQIAGDPADVDVAMELGYAWRRGPFKIRDGLSATALAALESDLVQAPVTGGTSGGPQDRLARAKTGSALTGNAAASLWDLGGGIACLELHTKMNTIDAAVLEMIERTQGLMGGPVRALVIGNHDARAFSAGANLAAMAERIEAQDWAGLAAFIARGQAAYAALRAAPVPVEAAINGLALGGGCELSLHAHTCVAHAEARLALPEHLVGLLPAWGGCTRLLARAQSSDAGALGPEAVSRRVFEAVRQPRPAGSAREAVDLGLLRPDGPMVMYPGDTLDAAARIAEQQCAVHQPASATPLRLGGAAVAKALLAPLEARHEAGQLSAPDLEVARIIAGVVTGGPDAGPDRELPESTLLELEREAFLTLAGLPLTLERIRHMLRTGKPLRT